MDSIIFDLDGTLWDSTSRLYEAWNNTFEKYGLGRPFTHNSVYKYMGATIEDFANDMPNHIPFDERYKISEESWLAEIPYLAENGGILYDGVLETLDKLAKKYRLFIVSNCVDGYIQAFFNSHGLQKYFEDIEYIGRTGLSKEENIRLVIERNKLTSPIYVGDTEKDFIAADAVGIPFIFASYGFGEAKEYKARLSKFSDLLDIEI